MLQKWHTQERVLYSNECIVSTVVFNELAGACIMLLMTLC